MKANSRKQKATELRKAITAFQERYGQENTVGIHEAVVTDFLSSEDTDGEASAAASTSRNQPKVLIVKVPSWRSLLASFGVSWDYRIQLITPHSLKRFLHAFDDFEQQLQCPPASASCSHDGECFGEAIANSLKRVEGLDK